MQTSDPDFHAEITLGRSSPVHSQSGEVEAQGSEEESSDYDDDFGLTADDFQSLGVVASPVREMAGFKTVPVQNSVEVGAGGKRLRSGTQL
ncbi:hypothetical protein FS749_012207 [Ceratobasidium sp. UAMH 11750]|nr:hypothetical protein FS749_012207 [Ceratobasidium sp. UAMH 11750]